MHDALPAKIGVFEIQQESKLKASDRQVTDHLRLVRWIKFFDDFRIHNDLTIHDDVGNQRVNQLSFVKNVEPFLLLNEMASLP